MMLEAVSITSEEVFGVPDVDLIPRINLVGQGIPSGEDFRRITLVPSIPPRLSIGDVRTHKYVFHTSIESQAAIGAVGIRHIVCVGVPSKEKISVPTLMIKNDKPGIDTIVASQFPAFMSEDHPRFIAFMEAYYSWLERKGGVLHSSRRVLSYQDIDDTIDDFAEHLFREFLPNIPRTALANRATLLKYIKQFYRAKGTEKSYKFFFRILYNTNVEFYYPRVDILRASDGKWVQHRTLRISPIKGDITKLASQKIRGKTKNCTAFVERLIGVEEDVLYGYELFLNRSSITGIFLPNEIIESEDGSIQARINPVPISITLLERGSHYKIGDTFDIVGPGKGFGAKAVVDYVDDAGAIQKITISSYGLDYSTETPPTIDFSVTPQNVSPPLVPGDAVAPQGRVVAVGKVVLGSLTNYPGYYLNEDGQLSTTKYLHDGEFYQQFSYVTYVKESLSEYKQLLRRLIHPAGLKHFGGVRLQELLQTKLKNPKKHLPTTRKITLNHTEPLLNLHTMLTVKNNITKNPKTAGLGPTNYSIYRNRFNYKPFEKYDANWEMFGVNSNYWGDYYDLSNQKSSTPIKAFGHMKPKDVERDAPWMSINMVADSYIRMEPIIKLVSISVENFFGTCSIIPS